MGACGQNSQFPLLLWICRCLLLALSMFNANFSNQVPMSADSKSQFAKCYIPTLGNLHKWRGLVHQALWMGETLAPCVVRHVKVPTKELINDLKMDYKKTTNYQQMWLARDLARDWYLGGQRKSIYMIPKLMARI